LDQARQRNVESITLERDVKTHCAARASALKEQANDFGL
jgi:hypothetical protein